MVAFSKPTLLDYTCYELGHTWTPSCTQASQQVFVSVFTNALKVYGPLFIIAGLVRKRGKHYFKKKVWQEIMQSSLFLTTNGTLFITFFCLWRSVAIQSVYNPYTVAFLPCLMASYVAILVERKSRRGLLAVYMGQVAIETLWRMFEARGYVKSIPNGEVLVFSVACAVYLYYFKQNKGLPDGTMSIFKKLFGPHETTCPAPNEVEMGPVFSKEEDENRQIIGERRQENGVSIRHSTSSLHHQAVRWLKDCPQHRLCRHRYSCVYYVIQGTLKLFGAGYGIQAGIKLIGSLSKIVKQPKSVIKQALFNTSNLQLGAFLGSFVGIYRAVNCLLRWYRDKDKEVHGMIAGFLAGWSMLFYKSQTIALYTAAKLAEVLYFKGISLGVLPYIRCADIIVYSISTAIVFHAAVIEPHNLRPAYWRFLLRVTGNKFAEMNRKLIDPFIPGCSKLFPGYWPDYDLRFTKLVRPDNLK